MYKGKLIKAENQRTFQKVKSLLREKGINTNNLPADPSPLPMQPQRIMPRSSQEQDDSMGQYLEAYFKRKNEQKTQNSQQHSMHSIDTRQAYRIKEVTKKQSKPAKKPQINLDQYSFGKQGEPIEKQSYKIKKKQNSKQQERIQDKIYIPKLILQKNTKLKTVDDVISNDPLVKNYIPANNEEWENKNNYNDYKLYSALRKFSGIKQFKNNQKAIVKCALEQHDIFVCMPTGGGKSLTFQILTFLDQGVYLCILPLISLIFDQYLQAKQFGIEAYSLTGNTQLSEVKFIFDKLEHFQEYGNSIVLFCTPEKLNLSQRFIEVIDVLYQRKQLKRIIIDEVHCVSTWGKQFRKEYQNLSSLKKRYSKTPILALTATVTQKIKQDIISNLKMTNCYFFQSSFNRPNLYYEVRPKTKNFLDQINEICKSHKNQSGIIYCLTKKQCEQVCQKMRFLGHKIAFYHADVKQTQKKYIQQSWMKNQINIITATIAFGMGINKPDVRYVIHHTMSKSLENYYQQSGRAGRDGQPAKCILFYRKSDKMGLQSMTLKNDYSTIQSKEFSTKQLAQMIKYCEQKYLCRRKFQLLYLGETNFDSSLCNKTCDNCRRGLQFKEFDYINQAKALISCLMRIEEFKFNISKNQIISIARQKVQKAMKYKLDQYQKAGIDFSLLTKYFYQWKAEDIETLIIELLSLDILTQKVVQTELSFKGNKGNVNNVYLKCITYKCKVFLAKVQTLPIRKQYKEKFNKEIDKQIDEIDQTQQEKEVNENTCEQEEFKLEKFEDPQQRKKIRHIIAQLFQDDDQ